MADGIVNYKEINLLCDYIHHGKRMAEGLALPVSEFGDIGSLGESFINEIPESIVFLCDLSNHLTVRNEKGEVELGLLPVEILMMIYQRLGKEIIEADSVVSPEEKQWYGDCMNMLNKYVNQNLKKEHFEYKAIF